MRVKLLKGQDDTTLVLTYVDTADEYRQALEVLGRPAWPVGDRGPNVCSGSGPGHAPYVVTTATQRTDWGLPDLTLRPGARVVDEARALDLLHDGASRPHTAATPFPGHHAQAVPSAENGASVASALDRALAVSAPGARLDAVLAVLEAAGVPRRVRESLTLEQAPARMPGVSGSERVRGRLQMLLALPWAAVRAAGLQPGSRRRSPSPHARCSRGCQDPHPPSTGGLSADPRSADHRTALFLPAGGRRAARPARAPGIPAALAIRSLPGRPPGDRQDVVGRRRRRGARPHPHEPAAGPGGAPNL